MVRKKAVSSTIGHIHIKDINLYDDKKGTQHITFDTPLDIRENITVKQNLSTGGTEDITHKDNTKQTITYNVKYNTSSKKYLIDNVSQKHLSLYQNNKYIFSQTDNSVLDKPLLISEKKNGRNVDGSFNIYSNNVVYKIGSDINNLSPVNEEQYKSSNSVKQLIFTPNTYGEFYYFSSGVANTYNNSLQYIGGTFTFSNSVVHNFTQNMKISFSKNIIAINSQIIARKNTLYIVKEANNNTTFKLKGVENTNNSNTIQTINIYINASGIGDRITISPFIYKNGPFITNSGVGVKKNINIGSNITVSNGLFHTDNKTKPLIGFNTLTPRSNVDINTTNAMFIPSGTTAQRVPVYDGLFRYNQDIKSFEGASEGAWGTVGGIQDIDKDTKIEVQLTNRANQIACSTEGTEQFSFLGDDNLTFVGINNIVPNATLDINGNLNIQNDSNIGGVLIGYDTTGNADYLNVEINNNTTTKSIELNSDGGMKIDLKNDLNSIISRFDREYVNNTAITNTIKWIDISTKTNDAISSTNNPSVLLTNPNRIANGSSLSNRNGVQIDLGANTYAKTIIMAHLFNTDANSKGSVLHVTDANDHTFYSGFSYSPSGSDTLPLTSYQPIVNLDASQIYNNGNPNPSENSQVTVWHDKFTSNNYTFALFDRHTIAIQPPYHLLYSKLGNNNLGLKLNNNNCIGLSITNLNDSVRTLFIVIQIDNYSSRNSYIVDGVNNSGPEIAKNYISKITNFKINNASFTPDNINDILMPTGFMILSCNVNNGYTDITIGTRWGQDGMYSEGIIYEVLFYKEILITSEITEITNYLNKKWSMYNTTPQNIHINSINNATNQAYANKVELLKQNSQTKTDKRFISSSNKTISEIQIMSNAEENNISKRYVTLHDKAESIHNITNPITWGGSESYIYEVLIFNSILSEDDRKKFVKYLNKKYQVYTTGGDNYSADSSSNYSSTGSDTLPTTTNNNTDLVCHLDANNFNQASMAYIYFSDKNSTLDGNETSTINGNKQLNLYKNSTENYNSSVDKTTVENFTKQVKSNVIETFQNKKQLRVDGHSTETYSNNYNVNISGFLDTSIYKNKNLTIYNNSINTYLKNTNIKIGHNLSTVITGNNVFSLNNDNIETIKQNKLQHISNNFIETIKGNNNIIISNTYGITVSSNSNETYNKTLNKVTNNLTETIEGAYIFDLQEKNTNTFYKNLNINTHGNLLKNIDTNYNINIEKNISNTIKSDSNIYNTTTKELTIKGNLTRTIDEDSTSIYYNSNKITVANNVKESFKSIHTFTCDDSILRYNSNYTNITHIDNNINIQNNYNKTIKQATTETYKNNVENIIESGRNSFDNLSYTDITVSSNVGHKNYLLDNNPDTTWEASDYYQQNIEFNFPNNVIINQYKVYIAFPTTNDALLHNPKKFHLEYFNGTTWITIANSQKNNLSITDWSYPNNITPPQQNGSANNNHINIDLLNNSISSNKYRLYIEEALQYNYPAVGSVEFKVKKISNYTKTINQSNTSLYKNTLLNIYNEDSTNIFKANNNVTIGEDLTIQHNSIHNTYVKLDNLETYKKNRDITTEGNYHFNVNNDYIKYIQNNDNISYKDSNSIVVGSTYKDTIKDKINNIIYNSNIVTIKNNSTETYKNNFHHITNSLHETIDYNSNIINNGDKVVKIQDNSTELFEKNSNININNSKDVIVKYNHNLTVTQNNNYVVGENKNTSIIGNFNNTITDNYFSTINNNFISSINGSVNETYHQNKTITQNALDENIEGTRTLIVSGHTTETYRTHNYRTILGEYKETITGQKTTRVTGDILIQSKQSDFQIITSNINANINLKPTGRVHLTNLSNTIEKPSLLIEGGSYIKKDVFFGEDLVLYGNLNVIGNNSSLYTEQVTVEDPLIVLGANERTVDDYTGILNRYKTGANYRFTGLVEDKEYTFTGEYNKIWTANNTELYRPELFWADSSSAGNNAFSIENISNNAAVFRHPDNNINFFSVYNSSSKMGFQINLNNTPKTVLLVHIFNCSDNPYNPTDVQSGGNVLHFSATANAQFSGTHRLVSARDSNVTNSNRVYSLKQNAETKTAFQHEPIYELILTEVIVTDANTNPIMPYLTVHDKASSVFNSSDEQGPSNGNIFEMLVFDTILSTEDIKTFSGYLNKKFSIYKTGSDNYTPDASGSYSSTASTTLPVINSNTNLICHLDINSFSTNIPINTKQYGLLHNIIPNSTNTQQPDTVDITNTFTNTNNAKLSNYANITLNNTRALSTVDINSEKSGIYTNGSLGVTHNVNIGNHTNNNGKIVLGASNIYKTSTNFNLDSDKHIFLNTTNSKPITITSDNDLNKTSGTNYTSLINTTLTENVTGKSNIDVKIDNNDTYKSNVNTTVHQGLTSITTGFANLNIHQYNKITFKNDSEETIKKKSYTYVKNSITEGGITYSLKELYQSDLHRHINNCEESYTGNKNITIAGTLTETITNSNINYLGNNNITIKEDCFETFNNKYIQMNQNYDLIIKQNLTSIYNAGSSEIRLNNNITYNKNVTLINNAINFTVNLNKTKLYKENLVKIIEDNSTTTINKNSNITISNNLTSIVSGAKSNLINKHSEDDYKKDLRIQIDTNSKIINQSTKDLVIHQNTNETYKSNKTIAIKENVNKTVEDDIYIRSADYINDYTSTKTITTTEIGLIPKFKDTKVSPSISTISGLYPDDYPLMRSNFDSVGYISDFHDFSLAGFEGGPNGVSTDPNETLTSNSLGGDGSAVDIFRRWAKYWRAFSTDIHQGGDKIDLDATYSGSGNLFHVNKFIGWNFNTPTTVTGYSYGVYGGWISSFIKSINFEGSNTGDVDDWHILDDTQRNLTLSDYPGDSEVFAFRRFVTLNTNNVYQYKMYRWKIIDIELPTSKLWLSDFRIYNDVNHTSSATNAKNNHGLLSGLFGSSSIHTVNTVSHFTRDDNVDIAFTKDTTKYNNSTGIITNEDHSWIYNPGESSEMHQIYDRNSTTHFEVSTGQSTSTIYNFDIWSGYDFNTTTTINGYTVKAYSNISNKWKLQGSNDGNTWTDLDIVNISINDWSAYETDGTGPIYKKIFDQVFNFIVYRIYMLEASDANFYIREFQLYNVIDSTYRDHNKIIDKNFTSIVLDSETSTPNEYNINLGSKTLNIFGENTETYKQDKTIKISNDLKETVTGQLVLNYNSSTATYSSNRNITINGHLTNIISGNKTITYNNITTNNFKNNLITTSNNLVETITGSVNKTNRNSSNLTIDSDVSETIYSTNSKTITGHYNINIGGSLNKYVKNNVFENVNVNKNTTILGNLTQDIGGTYIKFFNKDNTNKEIVLSNITIGKNLNTTLTGNLIETYTKNYNLDGKLTSQYVINDNCDETYKKDFTMITKDDLTKTITGTYKLSSITNNINIGNHSTNIINNDNNIIINENNTIDVYGKTTNIYGNLNITNKFIPTSGNPITLWQDTSGNNANGISSTNNPAVYYSDTYNYVLSGTDNNKNGIQIDLGANKYANTIIMAHLFNTDANSKGSVLHLSTANNHGFDNELLYSPSVSDTLPYLSSYQPIVNLDASQIYNNGNPNPSENSQVTVWHDKFTSNNYTFALFDRHTIAIQPPYHLLYSKLGNNNLGLKLNNNNCIGLSITNLNDSVRTLFIVIQIDNYSSRNSYIVDGVNNSGPEIAKNYISKITNFKINNASFTPDNINDILMPTGFMILSCNVNNGYTDITIGTRWGQEGMYSEGIIYEVLFYKEILNPSQMTDITKYLNKKWSMYSTDTTSYPDNRHVNAIDNATNQAYANKVYLLKQNSTASGVDKRFINVNNTKYITEIQTANPITNDITANADFSAYSGDHAYIPHLTDGDNSTEYTSWDRHTLVKWEERDASYSLLRSYDVIYDDYSTTVAGYITNFSDTAIAAFHFLSQTYISNDTGLRAALYVNAGETQYWRYPLHLNHDGLYNQATGIWVCDTYLGYNYNTATAANQYQIEMSYGNSVGENNDKNTPGFLKKWKFQGSDDFKTWVTINAQDIVSPQTKENTWLANSGNFNNYTYSYTFAQTNYKMYRFLFEEWVEHEVPSTNYPKGKAWITIKKLKILNNSTNILPNIGHPTTQLVTGNQNQWIGFQFATPTILNKYTITPQIYYTNGNNSAKIFYIQYYNYTTRAWTTFTDSQENLDSSDWSQAREFTFTNNNPYTKYRLYVESLISGNKLTITQIKLENVIMPLHRYITLHDKANAIQNSTLPSWGGTDNRIYEILVFNSILSDADRIKFVKYLNKKYQVYSTGGDNYTAASSSNYSTDGSITLPTTTNNNTDLVCHLDASLLLGSNPSADNNNKYISTFNSTSNISIKNNLSITIDGNNVETYNTSSFKTIHGNVQTNLSKSYNINIGDTSTEKFNNKFYLTQHNNIKYNIGNSHNIKIVGDSNETYDNEFYTKSKENNRIDSTGFYNITSTNNINISSSGGIRIAANHNYILDMVGNVFIKYNMCYIPNIIKTADLCIDDDYVSDDLSTEFYELTQTNTKTLNIIYINDIVIDNSNTLLSSFYNNKDIYIKLKLSEGKFNGQIIKLCLHPIFETTFNINNRLNAGYNTDVIIRIDSFCDANDNEFVSADLVLNRGGMCINLIYIDTTTDDSVNAYKYGNETGTGYWMLMDNSFTN